MSASNQHKVSKLLSFVHKIVYSQIHGIFRIKGRGCTLPRAVLKAGVDVFAAVCRASVPNSQASQPLNFSRVSSLKCHKDIFRTGCGLLWKQQVQYSEPECLCSGESITDSFCDTYKGGYKVHYLVSLTKLSKINCCFAGKPLG